MAKTSNACLETAPQVEARPAYSSPCGMPSPWFRSAESILREGKLGRPGHLCGNRYQGPRVSQAKFHFTLELAFSVLNARVRRSQVPLGRSS